MFIKTGNKRHFDEDFQGDEEHVISNERKKHSYYEGAGIWPDSGAVFLH